MKSKSSSPVARLRRVIAVRVFPWLVVMAGGAACAIGIDSMRKARASLAWPTVDGTVIQSSVTEERTSRSSGSPAMIYRPVVRFEYDVSGERYEGRRVSFGEYATGDPADAALVIARFPVGRRVRISYQPDAPSESVLEPGVDGIPWFYVGLGGVFLLTGVVLVVVSPRLYRP